MKMKTPSWVLAIAFLISGLSVVAQESEKSSQLTASSIAESLQRLDLSEEQKEEIRELFQSLRDQKVGRIQRQRQLRQGLAKILTRDQRIALRKDLRRSDRKETKPVEPVIAVGDESTVNAYLKAAEYSAMQKGISMLIMKDGEIVFEHYPNGGSSDRAHELASGTKSFSGLIAVAAMEDKLLKLDEPVSATIHEWKADPKKKDITIRQLLTLTSGIEPNNRNPRVPDYPTAIAKDMKHEPGEKFEYGSVPFQVFGELIQRKLKTAGRDQTPLNYLNERILEPCGIEYARWRHDKFDNPHLPSGAALTARDWAKLGQMIVDNGKVDGKRVLKKKSIDICFKGTEQNPVYGLTWWLYRPIADASVRDIPQVRQNMDAEKVPGAPEDLVMAAGAGKQRLFISRKENLVIVRQADGIAASLAGRGTDYKDSEFLKPLFETM